MPLALYLDDCANSELLAKLVQLAGHGIVRPTDEGIGLEGADDHEHFAYAASNHLTLITKNPADFKAIHDSDQRHFGILGIYQDNNPSKDMSNADIVKTIKNLEEATLQGGPSFQGEFHVLNDWQY